MKKQEYTYSKVHLWKDKNKSDSEMWHLFPSHSCSPGDLAAKEKEKEEGCAMRILSLKSSDGEMMNWWNYSDHSDDESVDESRKKNNNLKRGGKAIDCRQKMDITPYNINLCATSVFWKT